MFIRIAPADPGRVLAIVLAPQFSGHAVVDGWGLAPGSFATWDLHWPATREALLRSFRRHIVRSLSRFRPAVVVLGIPRFDDPASMALRETAMQIAAAYGVPSVERLVTQARQLLLSCRRGSCDDALAEKVMEGFFPELSALRAGKQTIQRRYRRHTFEAAALAVHELVERAPLSAAVIAKDAAFAMGTFNAALTASARRHFPDNL